MANPFVHVELQTQDPEKAKKFYGSLFDWKLEEAPAMPGYTMLKAGEGPGGGIMKSPVAGGPSRWVTYVQVTDVERSTSKARELGGTVLIPKTEIPGMGSYSIIAD